MEIMKTRNQMFEKLVELSKLKGYILIDDIIESLSVNDVSIPIDEVDRLCERLMDVGVILKETEPNNEYFDENVENDSLYDKSQLDYEEIFKRVETVDSSLGVYVDRLRQILPPQRGEEARLIHHAKEDNPYARERIIIMYLKVALRIALSYCEKYGLSLDETIQEANIGLLLALDKMPLTPDNRFSTYSTWWIRQNISRETQGISKKFYYIPAFMKEKLFKVIYIKDKNGFSLCDEAKHDEGLINEVCLELNVDEDTAFDYLVLLEPPLSLEEEMEQENDIFSDRGQTAERMYTELEKEDLRNRIEFILSSLGDREREILELRFGFRNDKEYTLEEVGNMFELTRERIRQIQAKALKKLRNSPGVKYIKQF